MAKRAALIGVILLVIALTVYFCFGSGNFFNLIKSGVQLSIEEDFKIKESLGKIFFAKGDSDEAVTVSSDIDIGYALPAGGEVTFSEILGESVMSVSCKPFSHIGAIYGGTVEECATDSVTVRLADGIKAVYSGVVPLCKCNDELNKGDIIGFAKGDISIRLYKNCVNINAGEYFR